MNHSFNTGYFFFSVKSRNYEKIMYFCVYIPIISIFICSSYITLFNHDVLCVSDDSEVDETPDMEDNSSCGKR